MSRIVLPYVIQITYIYHVTYSFNLRDTYKHMTYILRFVVYMTDNLFQEQMLFRSSSSKIRTNGIIHICAEE